MKKPKVYRCRGFTYNNRNWHLCGKCGEIHTLDRWIEIVFGEKTEKAREFFKNDTDAEILRYLYQYYGLRMEKE